MVLAGLTAVTRDWLWHKVRDAVTDSCDLSWGVVIAIL